MAGNGPGRRLLDLDFDRNDGPIVTPLDLPRITHFLVEQNEVKDVRRRVQSESPSLATINEWSRIERRHESLLVVRMPLDLPNLARTSIKPQKHEDVLR